MDETRRGKPVFAQDPDTKRWVLVRDRWHTGFVDAAGTGGLLAQVEGRTSAATIAWLNAQPASWRAGITHVTIDLSASYAASSRNGASDLSASGVTCASRSLRSLSTSRLGRFRR